MGLISGAGAALQGVVWKVQEYQAGVRTRELNLRRSGRRALGAVGAADVLPAAYGRAALLCQDEGVRRAVLGARADELASLGASVAVVTQGGPRSRARALPPGTAAEPYDPLRGLSPARAASLLADAASDWGVGRNCLAWARAACEISSSAFGEPSLGDVASLPLIEFDEVVGDGVARGILRPQDAPLLRSALEPVPAAQELSYLLDRASGAGATIGVPGGGSLAQALRPGGVTVVEVAGQRSAELLSLALRDACEARGDVHVVIDLPFIAPATLEALPSLGVGYTISCDDLAGTCGAGRVAEALCRLEAFACFRQGAPTARLISSQIGDYEKQEITVTRGGATTVGTWGFSLAGGRGATMVAPKRSRIVDEEEVAELGDGEFLFYDRTYHGIAKGALYL